MELEELVKHGIEKEWIDRLANKAKIKRLYEYQAEIVEKKLLDESLIVSAPTASGKTLLAILKMIKALKKGKVVYLVPLVALGVEKYEDFKKFFEGKYKVALSVGDFDSTDLWLKDYDVIVATVEKFDSLLRHGVDWIGSVRLIVVDEIHLLNDVSRGPTLEILLTKLRRILKDVQIMGLSATISNAEELANWLGCKFYKTDFRPVKLYQGVAYDSKIRFIDKEGYELGEGEIDEEIVKNTLNLNKQILFFVGTRKRSEALAEKLAQVVKQKLSKLSLEQLAKVAEEVENVLEVPTKQCKKLARCIRCGVAFHHAGLLGKQKRLVEENFRNGLIKVIVATTTLAAGINTPAFRVAIRDVKRYYPGLGAVYIPVIEYQQMVGRCVAGDTLVFNKNGFPIQISEIASKYFKPNEVGRKDVKEDLEILSVDLNTFQPTFSKVLSIWKRKVNKLVEIETRSGKIIRVSPDHPILTFRKVECGKPSLALTDNFSLYEKVIKLRRDFGLGPNKIVKILGIPEKYRAVQHWLYDGNKPRIGALMWKNAMELKKGSYKSADYVASLLDFCNEKEVLPPTYFLPHDKLIRKSFDVYMTKIGHHICKFPLQWSEELVRFIAKIMSDGSIYFDKKSNSYLIRYFNKDPKVHEEYAEMCKKLFGKKVHTTFYRGTYQSSFKSFLVGEFLKNIGVPPGKKSLILRVPPVIFSLPKNLIETFLREYVFCDGWEGEVTYNFVSCSKKLAYDIALLISKIGMVARIHRKKPNEWRNRFLWNVSVTKSQFDNNKRLSSVGHIHPDMIKNIREINEEAYVYDLTLERNHNFVANGIVVHNSGRPQYDPYGEGILIAKNEDEAEELIERYLMSEPEPITSKLASEPALRMHTLALIATDFCKTEKSLKDFFNSTFFAYHYGDTYLIEEKIEKILDDLEEWNFITRNNKIEATRIGKRVVELYLDPLTAWWFVKGLEKKTGSVFGYLQLISQSLEMRPLPSVSTSDMVEIEKLIESKREEFLTDVPNEYDLEYEDFVRSVKLALMLEDWMNEATEEQILEKYRVTPGEFYARLQIADWLVYSLQELALLLKQKEKASMIRKIRVRLKYGVKEELLPLVKLEGIGRVRARKLYNAGIRNIADLKKISLESLIRLIGAKTAKKVKDQLEEKKEKKIKQTTLA